MESVTFVLCLLVLSAHALLVFGVDCYVNEHNLMAGQKVGSKYRCVEYNCIGKDHVTMFKCPPLTAPNKNCKEVKEDLSKPYPSCCPSFKDC